MTEAQKEAFKEALAEALVNSGPVKRHLIKKKLRKNKIGVVELEAFIKEYAKEAYDKIMEAA